MSKKFADMTDKERLDAIRDPKFQRRYWAKVSKTGTGEWECWVWTAGKNHKGYGMIWVGESWARACRVGYMLIHGAIPSGMQIDHRCGNRVCVRASHLRVVTPQQNMQHRTVMQRNNTSGRRGVSWDQRHQKWHAYAKLGGKRVHLGYYDDIDAADQAAKAYRAEHFTHDDHHEWGKPAA